MPRSVTESLPVFPAKRGWRVANGRTCWRAVACPFRLRLVNRAWIATARADGGAVRKPVRQTVRHAIQHERLRRDRERGEWLPRLPIVWQAVRQTVRQDRRMQDGCCEIVRQIGNGCRPEHFNGHVSQTQERPRRSKATRRTRPYRRALLYNTLYSKGERRRTSANSEHAKNPIKSTLSYTPLHPHTRAEFQFPRFEIVVTARRFRRRLSR